MQESVLGSASTIDAGQEEVEGDVAEVVTIDRRLQPEIFGLPLPLRTGWSRLWVGVQLVRRAEARRLPRLTSAAQVFQELRGLALIDREVFLLLLLTQKNQVSGLHVASIGGLSTALVHPREILTVLILGKAAAFIVVHAHPSSGDPSPSREDREITARLKACGELMGIPLVDHVVIGSDSYRSFAESGLL